MSAIQRLMTTASSGAASNSSNSSAYDDNKIEKRACELERRREKALKDTKGTARWQKFFQVVTSRDLQTDEATAVHLLCTLCDTKLSATNESRIATTHLKHAGCSKVKSNTEIAAQVAAAFIKDAAPEQQDPDDKEVFWHSCSTRSARLLASPLLLRCSLAKRSKCFSPWLFTTSF
ncbi:TPA: hypothetical protein ACH3X1_015856 [Trebouxia sp. C0004]